MKTIDLSKYGPIISDKEIGQEIFELISIELNKNDKIEINLAEIKSMATFCAKQIFGALYISLSAPVFFEKITLRNANNDLKTIIKIGIQNAIENSPD